MAAMLAAMLVSNCVIREACCIIASTFLRMFNYLYILYLGFPYCIIQGFAASLVATAGELPLLAVPHVGAGPVLM